MPIKLRLRQCPLLRIVPMKKEGHMIWVVNDFVVWGFCCAAADHKNLFSFLHTILHPPVCVRMYVTWLIVNLSLCHVQFIVRYICLGCEKEPPMDTRCEKDQAQNRTNYFSATSTVAYGVTALPWQKKKHATGRFENGLILQRKGKGCLVGKQSTQLLYYFVPFEKGLKCGKQKGTI